MATFCSFDIFWPESETLLSFLRRELRKAIHDDARSLVKGHLSEEVSDEAQLSVSKLITVGDAKHSLSKEEKDRRRQVMEVNFKTEFLTVLNVVYPKDNYFRERRHTFR